MGNANKDDLAVFAPDGEPTVTMTRTFKAPRALVWRVWTDPVHVSRWWGASEGLVEVLRMDVRPGGEWRFAGSGMIFYGRYLAVDEPSRLVNSFGIEGMYADDGLTETHTFEERDGLTHYTSHSVLSSIEARDGLVASNMETGARASLNELAIILDELQR